MLGNFIFWAVFSLIAKECINDYALFLLSVSYKFYCHFLLMLPLAVFLLCDCYIFFIALR